MRELQVPRRASPRAQSEIEKCARSGRGLSTKDAAYEFLLFGLDPLERENQHDKPSSTKDTNLLPQPLSLLTSVPARTLVYETGKANDRYQRSGGYQDIAPSWAFSLL
jgi:hypothetical protein